MIKLQYLLYSKQVLIDETTKHASVINLIENISAPKFPAVLHESFVSTLFTRDLEKDKESYKAEYKVLINKKTIGGATIDLLFQGKKRNRCVIKFPPMPIKEPGALNILVYIDGKRMGSLDIDVVELPQKK